ncbi:MAG TPA: glycosyltransferase family 39 protein [Fimbriiglobus sp.]|nr:glycosyltransferase family 39 protein [Fimbriiglobus sp.]
MQQATDANRISHLEAISPVAVKSPFVVETPTAQLQALPPRWRAALPIVLVVSCLLAGLALRTFCYARNQSLWIDEAFLALNVVYRTVPELAEPLDLNQGAPLGYLLVCKSVVKAFGSSELALRLPSFVAALVGFAAFIRLAYRMLPLAAARIAVCLFALSPYLIAYAAEFKQYELDATVAILLTLIGLPVWRDEAGPWRLVGFAAAGAVAVWVSHPAAFVLGGVGTAALADAAARRDRAALLARLGVVAAWLVSFGLCYALFLRKLGTNQFLLDYWAGKFMPFPPTSPGDLAWVVDHFLKFFDKPGGLTSAEFATGGLAALGFLLAVLVLARRDWRLLVALVGPLGLALVASAVHKYPFAGRLLLYAVPALVLMVAYGAALIAARLGEVVRWGGVVTVAVLFVSPVAECRWLLKTPPHAEDAREAIAHVHAHWQPGDRLYVYYGAVPAFAYYLPRFPFPADAVVLGSENRDEDQRKFQVEIAPLDEYPRVWVVLAHRQTQEETAIQAYLDAMGRREELKKWSDATVMRYDLTTPPAQPVEGPVQPGRPPK